jgi:acyl-coenzyme A thioesterase PaaI-like protein
MKPLIKFNASSHFNISRLVERQGELSAFHLPILNQVLGWMIPFNRPHGVRINHLAKGLARAYMPYKRTNFNHLKGIHAGGIITLGEFCAGICLLTLVNNNKYRLILKELKATYTYQAKTKIEGVGQLTVSEQEQLINRLNSDEPFDQEMRVTIKDKNGETVAEVVSVWQIKSWKKVKTKVNE